MKGKEKENRKRLWQNWLIVLFYGICTLIPTTSVKVYAQKSDSLNTVEVYAPRRMYDTGIQKTHISSQILHEDLSHSMADILTQNSTLFIKSYGRGTEATAEFRGTSPNHTQVLWNGIKVNSPSLGTTDFSLIPAYFVDEVQLFHGASSINLVGGGLGGAIDMSTQPLKEEGTTLHYVQGIGSYKTFDQFLRLSYKNEHWSSSTRAVYSCSDNDFKYTNYDKKIFFRDEDGNIIGSKHPVERNKSGYFKDLHLLQDTYYDDKKGNKVGVAAWYTHTLRGLPFLSVDYKDNKDFCNEQRQDALRSMVSWKHSSSWWKSELCGGYMYQGMEYEYFTSRDNEKTNITHTQSHTHTGFLQAQADFMPHEKWLITGDVSGYYNHIESKDRSPYHIGENYNKGRFEGNASVQARWRPLEQFTLAFTLREEIYGKKFTPVSGAFFADYVLWKKWNLTLKASVAKNHRVPSMDDLYFKPGGNPYLQPEEGFSYDGGIEFKIPLRRGHVRGQVTGFDSHINNWIQWLPNARGFWEPHNLKKVHNYGIEMMLGTDFNLGKEWSFGATGNYAFTPSINQGEGVNGNDASFGKQLCYVPRHSANLMLLLRWKTWSLTYRWNYYSERFTTTSNEPDFITGRLLPYHIADAALQKTFLRKWGEASFRCSVNNLWNKEYVTVLSRPMAPRNFEIYVELKPKWKPK